MSFIGDEAAAAHAEELRRSEEDFMQIKTTKVVSSVSGVNRDTDEGKINWILTFDGPMLKRWAQLLTRGMAVRGKRNWLLGDSEEDYERFREGAARHFAQWVAGEDDEDHAAAVFFNISGAENVKGKLSA